MTKYDPNFDFKTYVYPYYLKSLAILIVKMHKDLTFEMLATRWKICLWPPNFPQRLLS